MNEGNNHSPEQGDQEETENLGIAGATAKFFINSPLSPLLYISMLFLGLAGLIMTPRQEDPQISVPMVDIMVSYPGASADQVASLAIQPLERIMSEIKGVEHVYSASERGQGIVTVQFFVGEDMETSLVKVNDQIDSNMDKIPPGVSPPLVKAKGIDDVPVVTLTLWSEKDYNGDGIPDVDDSQLRRLALSVLQGIKEIPETGEGFVVGGRAEQVTIEVFPERLSGYGISLGQVAEAIQSANAELQVGDVESSGSRLTVVTGSFLETVDDINQLQVGNHNGVPVYVYDVAEVRQGPEDAKQMVAYYTGAASEEPDAAVSVPAVTVAVAKKKGTNGVSVAKKILERVELLKGRLIPDDIHVSVTRNYGQTADDKVTSLIFKLFIATGFVFLLVWAAFRALKPALVVLLVIPVVLLFTIFFALLTDFTIDRVSLFALIFSIGILVDDAIVVVENIYRRWLEEGKTDVATAIDAVREVGNPTILATFTVIGALLPMGFVTGMMGPYMLPIPILGSAAMFISLFAAFVFTPWLAINKLLRPSMHYLETAEKREHKEAEWLEGLYRRILMPMIEHKSKARLFRLTMWAVFLLMCSMFYFKWVSVKMLPLDNKPEFSIVLDMPEGTALAETANSANRLANWVRKLPEVTAVQIYVGTARPFDFNGMVRHYYMRKQPWQAEVQVQLLHKSERKRSSHEIAVATRAAVSELLKKTGASYAVVEMPPGPPVLQSVVADVHGPDAETRRKVASDLTQFFSETESLRDVDNYMREPYDYWHFQVDREKADRRSISVDTINKHLGMALGGMVLGDVKQRAGHEPINIVIQVPLSERSQISRLGDILIMSPTGVSVPLRELGEFLRIQEEAIIYHKDLRPVEYVVADVGGRLAAPVYGMLQLETLLRDKQYITPDGVLLADATNWMGPPDNDNFSSIEWTGEWTVTYETFRDMGIAFGAALVLIYILVVWEFGSFRIPALIMAPIPLTLLGIIPAHAIFFYFGWGGEFTATSMIGWIALAGIIVRNSILLVDFSIHELRKGTPVAEAVIQACKTRTRPILITAFALVMGSSVIFFDPIFQGMAISLASGVLVSTVLTLIVIPLGCVSAAKSLCLTAGVECVDDDDFGTSGSGPLPGRITPNRGFISRTWSGVASFMIWSFYLFRGIYMLIASMIKKAPPLKGVQSAARKAHGVEKTTAAAPGKPKRKTSRPVAAKAKPTEKRTLDSDELINEISEPLPAQPSAVKVSPVETAPVETAEEPQVETIEEAVKPAKSSSAKAKVAVRKKVKAKVASRTAKKKAGTTKTESVQQKTQTKKKPAVKKTRVARKATADQQTATKPADKKPAPQVRETQKVASDKSTTQRRKTSTTSRKATAKKTSTSRAAVVATKKAESKAVQTKASSAKASRTVEATKPVAATKVKAKGKSAVARKDKVTQAKTTAAKQKTTQSSAAQVKKSVATKPSVVSKKGQERRGIRLKTLETNGLDGLV